MYHCGADTTSAGLWVHHQLRHAEPIFLPRRKIQVTNYPLVSLAATGIMAGGQQVPGAPMRQLPQNLLTDRYHFIEFRRHADEFTYLLLLLRGQHHPPLG